jgi:predicted transcriptional regulator
VKSITFDVRDPEETMAEFAMSWNSGKPQKQNRISFATPELLWKVLSAKRWDLLKVMCGAGPISIREAARRSGRDVKAVHRDLTALLEAGVIERTESGAVLFDFDSVKIEFVLQAA